MFRYVFVIRIEEDGTMWKGEILLEQYHAVEHNKR